MTVTYKYPPGEPAARHSDAERLVRALGGSSGGEHILGAFGGDPMSDGRPHHHLLLTTFSGAPIDRLLVDVLWTYVAGTNAGRVDVQTAGPGCVSYVARHSDPMLAVGCPREARCRRPVKGCVGVRAIAALRAR